MAKGKYDDALAELTAHAAEIPDIVTAIKKRLSSNERSGKLSLDTDITVFLKQKTMPGRDEQLEIFRQGFKTAYGLSDENYGKMSALISDVYHEKPDYIFNAQGILITERAEALAIACLGVPEKKDVAFELFADRIPDKYKGIKTLGDLIDRYSAVETGLRQKEQECQTAQSKISAHETRINQLQADLNSLEGKIDAKYKTQIDDLKVQLERYKSIGKDSAGAEHEMHKLLEAMDKTDGIPPAVRLKFNEAYLSLNPKNKLLESIVIEHIGCIYATDFNDDAKALPYIEKAVAIADELYRADPDPAGDAAAYHDSFMANLEACKRNMARTKAI